MNTKRTIKIAAIAALTSLTTSLVSCVIDTPQTIAWSYYWCAKDTMDAGDPYAALDYLKGATRRPLRSTGLPERSDSWT